jgi:hypothetical protein
VLAPTTTKHLLVIIFTKLGVTMEFYKTWERSIFRACSKSKGNQERGVEHDLLPA